MSSTNPIYIGNLAFRPIFEGGTQPRFYASEAIKIRTVGDFYAAYHHLKRNPDGSLPSIQKPRWYHVPTFRRAIDYFSWRREISAEMLPTSSALQGKDDDVFPGFADQQLLQGLAIWLQHQAKRPDITLPTDDQIKCIPGLAAGQGALIVYSASYYPFTTDDLEGMSP